MALDTKTVEEIRRLVPRLVNEGIITRREEHRKLAGFYRGLAEDSLQSAQLLHKVSTEPDLQSAVGFPHLKGFLWVINASYYSMFYMASAALAHSGLKIRSTIGIHTLTFNAFTYYFYLTNKIAKRYIEEFFEALEDSGELLGKEEVVRKAEEKAKELVLHLESERKKRRIFTYELEKTRIEARAKTSLERANHFYKEMLKLITPIGRAPA